MPKYRPQADMIHTEGQLSHLSNLKKNFLKQMRSEDIG